MGRLAQTLAITHETPSQLGVQLKQPASGISLPFRKQASDATQNYPCHARRSLDERPGKELKSTLIKCAVGVQAIKEYDDTEQRVAAGSTSGVRRRRKKEEIPRVP